MPRIHEGALADLRTLMGSPPKVRRGFTSNESFNAPAAGANFLYTVGADYWRRIRSMGFTFASSSTTADRELSLALADGGGSIFNAVPIAGLRASSVTTQLYGDPDAIPSPPPEQTPTTYGEQTSPTAGTTIATLTSVGPGVVTVDWIVEVAGTLAEGTDNDNFILQFNGSTAAQSVNPALAGIYPQNPVDIESTVVNSITVKALNTASTGAIYSASVAAQLPGGSIIRFRVPDVMLQSGWQVQINVSNIQAADQIGNVFMLTEHYASDWASGTDYAEEEAFMDRLLERLSRE
jgi:hypothetical protein